MPTLPYLFTLGAAVVRMPGVQPEFKGMMPSCARGEVSLLHFSRLPYGQRRA